MNSRRQLAGVLILAGMSLTVAGTAEGAALETVFDGRANVYFRVVLEKANGIDMRANVMPQQAIEALERQGKAVRPSRTSANVGYWAFFRNGDFATAEVLNNPGLSDLSYEKLEELFMKAPRDGTKWKKGEHLSIGTREYAVRVLEADDPATGGRKGEVEVAVLKGGKKLYYYVGSFVRNLTPPRIP